MTASRNTYYDSIPLKTKTEVDIMSLVGQKGRWQLQVFLHVFFIMSLAALHNLSMTFLAPNLDHWCSESQEVTNPNGEDWKRVLKPLQNAQCSRYTLANVTGSDDELNHTSIVQIVPCHSWEYDETFHPSTILGKWNLVCDRKWLVSLTKSIFMIGFFMSAFLSGYLADRWGRKPIIILASIITTISTFLCPFAPSTTLFIVTRFVIGVGLGGYHRTAFTLLMEIVVPEIRPTCGTAVQLGWSLGFICLPVAAWLIRDSFWLQIGLSVPSFTMMLISWTLPESPRWLLSRNWTEEARQVLVHAAEKNRLTDTDIGSILEKVAIDIKRKEEQKRKTDTSSLLKTPGRRRLTVFLFLIWFIISFIYTGLSFNTNELVGNPFVNFALSGSMEVPAIFLSIYIIKSTGKQRPLAVSLIAGGITCLVLYLIPIDIPETIVAAAMIGKFCVTCSFGILYALSEELFPTTLYNIGWRSSIACGGLGSIVAPFARELAHATHRAIPQFLFGILSIAGGALVVFLPDVKNVFLPNTMEDSAHMSR